MRPLPNWTRRSVGYRLTAKVSTATAATVVLVLWAVAVAAKVGLAAAFGG